MQVARHVRTSRQAAYHDHKQHAQVIESAGCVRSRHTTRHVSAMSGSTATAATVKASGSPSTRQAWHITDQGDMSSLKLVDETLPALHSGEVLVEVKALGLNFADVFCCLGLYKAAPKGDFVPGLEFSGVVLQEAPSTNADTTVSSDAQPTADTAGSLSKHQHQQCYKPGDRVLGVPRFGAFASHVAIPTEYLRPIPHSPRPRSFEEAAAYPVQTLTAAYGLYACGGYRPGQAVLVQSAAGGVGLQALQILYRTGAAVLGFVGSDEKMQRLQELYASSVTNSVRLPAAQQQDTPEKQQHGICHLPPYMEFAKRLTSEAAAQDQIAAFLQRSGRTGFNVIMDSLGPGPYFKPSYEALDPCGRHVIFGAGSLTPKPGLKLTLNPAALLTAPASLWGLLQLAWGWVNRPKLDVINMPGDNKGVIGFNLIWLYDRLDILTELYDRVDALGLEAPVVDKAFEFEDLPEALAYLQSGCNVGKVVVLVGDQQPE